MSIGMEKFGICEKDDGDRVQWKCRTRVVDPRQLEEKKKKLYLNMLTDKMCRKCSFHLHKINYIITIVFLPTPLLFETTITI